MRIDVFGGGQRESENWVPGSLIEQGALPLDALDLFVRVVINQKVGFEFCVLPGSRPRYLRANRQLIVIGYILFASLSGNEVCLLAIGATRAPALGRCYAASFLGSHPAALRSAR